MDNIRLTPEEKDNLQTEWYTQGKNPIGITSDAQLRKVGKFIYSNFSFERDPITNERTGRIVISAECWAELKETINA